MLFIYKTEEDFNYYSDGLNVPLKFSIQNVPNVNILLQR